DGEVMAFAGLWEGWHAPNGETVRTFAITTTRPNAEMAVLHDRMPVILEQADWPTWLGETEGGSGRAAASAAGSHVADLAGEPGGQRAAQQRRGVAQGGRWRDMKTRGPFPSSSGSSP